MAYLKQLPEKSYEMSKDSYRLKYMNGVFYVDMNEINEERLIKVDLVHFHMHMRLGIDIYFELSF